MDGAPVTMDGKEIDNEVEKADMVVDLLARNILARNPVNEVVHVPKVVADRLDVVLRPFLKLGLDIVSLLKRLIEGNLEIGVYQEVVDQLLDNGGVRRG